jgi:hypothetical protein
MADVIILKKQKLKYKIFSKSIINNKSKFKIMKKFLFFISAILVFTIPVMSQGLVSDEVPVEFLTLKKGNIPPQVIKSAEKLFEGSSQIAWGVFPYELKNYGWVVNKEYNDPIDHYEIQFKGKDGSDIFAVFESTGELISERVVNKKAPVPPEIMRQIEKSEYTDWKITDDVMRVKNTQKKIIEHFVVKLEKGGMKKTLYFTTKGDVLLNK